MMIKKERLLAGLNEIAYVEEGMITLFTNFSKTLIKMSEDIDQDKKKEINGILTRLHGDSIKHKNIVDGLIEKVRREDKDEY